MKSLVARSIAVLSVLLFFAMPSGHAVESPQLDGLEQARLRGAKLVAAAEQTLNQIFAVPEPQAHASQIGVQANDLKFEVNLDQISYRPPSTLSPEEDGSIEILSPSGRVYTFEVSMAYEGPQIVALIRRLVAHGQTQIVLPAPYRVSETRNYYGIGGTLLQFELPSSHPLLAVLRAYQRRPEVSRKFVAMTCRQVFQ